MDIDAIFEDLTMFTKKEREWLKTKLRPAIKTTQGIAGRNCTINNNAAGQVIGARDCPPCP